MKRIFYSFILVFSMVWPFSGPLPSDLPSGLNHVPNELLVKFGDGVSASYSRPLHSRLNAVCLDHWPHLGIEKVRLAPGQDFEAALAAYRSDSAVVFVEPNYYTVALAAPNDPNYTNGNQWGLHNTGQSGGTADIDIDAPEAWDIATGDTVLVAVIDSGVDYDHPDLAANIWTNTGEIPGNSIDDDGNGYVDDIRGWDFFDNDNNPDDPHGHGTRVAGIIAAVGNNSTGLSGVNWTARIMPLKFTNDSASGTVGTTIAAIDYAIAKGAKVINYSHKVPGWSTPLLEAIQRADNAGILFVTSAGNDGTDNDTAPVYPASIPRSVGFGPNIIAAAAIGRNGAMPSYSNYGATSVELAAPGDAIYTTNAGGGYGTYNGTSYAAPFVSGVAALLIAAEPTLDHLSVRQRILDNVDAVAALSGKVITGGLLNAYKALSPTVASTDGVVLSSFVLQAMGASSARDTMRVEVSDADLDTSAVQLDVADVTVQNITSGEMEMVQAAETDVNTGIFHVRLPTVQGASGTDNDGVLALAAGDTLIVSYTDSLSALGAVEVRKDTTCVVGWFGGVRTGSGPSALDAHGLLRMASGLDTPSSLDLLRGDLDGDGEILGFDASLVLQHVVGIINRFPIQILDIASDPSGLRNHPFLKPGLPDRPVVLGAPQPQEDGSLLLPVRLAERGGVLSGVLWIRADSEIDVIDVSPGAGYGAFMLAHSTGPESIRIAFAGARIAGQGPGEVAWIRVFSPKREPVSLTIDAAALNGHRLQLPPTTIELAASGDPPSFTLYQNWPNPFNPATLIRYDLPVSAYVTLDILNALGQRIKTLISGYQAGGAHHITWNGIDELGRPVGSGVYLMHMRAGSFSATRKMLLLR